VLLLQSLADQLDQLIIASQELSKRDQLGCIYELAWYSMSVYEAGNADEAARQVVDILKDPRILKTEFLYDYRNTVGVLLSLFLTRKANLGGSLSELSNNILFIVKKLALAG
jgi:hypothetical protein